VDERALGTALEYARRGWPVLPCHAPTPYGRCSCGHHQCSSVGKHPRLQHGLREASSDETTVARWWARWPDANVAVLTGAVSGLVVIDVDRRHGGDHTLEELVARHGRLPRTATVQTGDGVHLYFAHPGQRIANDSGQRLGRGLDVRADGGYVLAPPSLHASGRRYLRLEPMNFIAPLPTWMIEELTRERINASPAVSRGTLPVNGDASAWAHTALELEVRRVASAVEGARNTTLNRAAFSLGQIVAGGLLDRAAVETALADAAHHIGLSEREAKLTIQSGLDAGSRTPRSPAPQPPRREPIANPTTDEPVASVKLVHWPKDFGGPSFAAGGEYVERCWTGVLGPTGVLMLRDLAHRLETETPPVHVNLDELGRALGVGHQGGRNSVLSRTMGRLERYGMAMALPDGTLALRTDIPPLPGAAVRRAAPRVAAFHRDQLSSMNQSRAPIR
jgi:hypothetical protein